MFTDRPFDSELLIAHLLKDYPSLQLHSKNDSMVFCFLDLIKVDFVYLPYPFINTPEVIDGIRLASLDDIMSMKISAIANR